MVETTIDEDFKRMLLDNMTWSFSRLSSFDQCPYCWKRNYLDCEEKESNAYAEYGTLCHSLLERYEKGELDMFSLPEQYEKEYYDVVQHEFPPNKYTDLNEKYKNNGYDYFSTINWTPEDIEILGVEEEVRFEIDGHPFVGYVDLRFKDKDGNIILADHKSANIKQTKKGGFYSADKDKIMMYKRQQYLYSRYFVEQGMKVDFLEWNFFDSGWVYKIPWNKEEYDEAEQWTKNTIKQIYACTEFNPDTSSKYFCDNICDYRNKCCDFRQA